MPGIPCAVTWPVFRSQQRWLGGIAILLSSMTLVLDLIFSLCA